ARAAAQASLDVGYDATAAAFARGWRAWMAGLTLPGPAQLATAGSAGLPGLADALQESAVVLRTHADHTVSGAYVAGLAIPWGNYGNDPGGYHLVWCRDGGETALALAAAGHTDDAATALGYLAGRQNRDGYRPPSIRRRRYSWMRSRSRCCSRASSTNSACPCPRVPTTRSRRRPATWPATARCPAGTWTGGRRTRARAPSPSACRSSRCSSPPPG